MNNEEKILAMLEQLTSDVTGIKGEVAELKATQARQGELLEELDDRSLRSAVMLENQVLPQLQALYEGHGAIMEKLDTLAEKSRVEALEDDVAMLKDSVKLMRIEINELKRVQ